MPGTSHRARYALGSTIVALSLALLVGALPILGGASADNTRELIRVSFRPNGAKGVLGWRSDHGEPFDTRRAYGWVRDDDSSAPVSMADEARLTSRLALRTDSFITMQPPRKRWGRWVMTVDPGTYRVTVTAGDKSGAAGTQYLNVEDQKVIDGFTPTPRTGTVTKTVDVDVTDGRLTIDPLYPNRGAKAKLVSVIVSVVLDDDHPPTSTTTSTTGPTTTHTTTTQSTTTSTTSTTTSTTTTSTTTPPGGLRNQVGFAGGGVFLSGSDADIQREMDGMAAAGATWLRVGFLWSSIEQSPGTYYWSRMDQVAEWARERGLRILANVSYTPGWARPADCRDMMCPPTDMDLYARFMNALVRHYSPRGVKAYEIWNEPNQYFWWKPRPQPARYAEMVRKASAQAHAADPTVTVLAGAMAPARDNEAGTTMNPRTFVAGMYQAGVAHSFDALSFHPYTGDSDPRVRAYWNMITDVGPDLAAIMSSHGDVGKKIWGTEMGYTTANHSLGVSEDEQARLTRLAIETWRQQSYAGVFFLFTYRDMGTDPTSKPENLGVVRRNFTPKPALYAVRDELRS